MITLQKIQSEGLESKTRKEGKAEDTLKIITRQPKPEVGALSRDYNQGAPTTTTDFSLKRKWISKTNQV
jgi:hypothetical protein